MAVVVVVVDSPADAAQAEAQWVGLGYRLIDVGAEPTGFKYYEILDMTAPIKNYAQKYVVVLSNT